jgi:hypothetical protein
MGIENDPSLFNTNIAGKTQIRADIISMPTSLAQQVLMETVGLEQYIGFSPCGTPTSTAAWKIMRLTTVAGELSAVKYANIGAYNVAWDNRLTASYS